MNRYDAPVPFRLDGTSADAKGCDAVADSYQAMVKRNAEAWRQPPLNPRADQDPGFIGSDRFHNLPEPEDDRGQSVAAIIDDSPSIDAARERSAQRNRDAWRH